MADRKLFPNSVVSLPATPGLTTQGMIVNPVDPKHRAETMRLHFSLAVPQAAQQELEARVAKGEVIPIAEQNARYGANAASADALVAWLKSEGFKDTRVTPDHTAVYASAPASQVEASLGVHMVRVTVDGQTYTAASDVPSLPAAVAADVIHIGGLQPFLRAHKHSRISHIRPVSRASKAGAAPIANAPPYLVAEIVKAYGGNGLGATGANQEIGILIDTFPLDSDLTAFWEINGVNTDLTRIAKIDVNGSATAPPEGEESLDTEWSSGIAPQAGIRIYASGTLQFTDLDSAIDKIIEDVGTRPGLRQVSISLGLGETFLNGPSGEIATQHQKYLRLAAAGVNVFVSSGDAGSNPDQSGHASDGPLQAEYAASDPYVIGVGGTSLQLTANGQVSSEVAWASSGGGKSAYFQRPAWQSGAGIVAGTERLVPDVSLTADPNEGALLILQGKHVQIGGTSWSAPVWAAFCALINELRVKNGKSPLSFLNPLLYPLLGTTAFRDVVSGSNGAYQAGPGYDLVTGLGVPDLQQLITKLT
jgi:kumamolisin